MLRIIRGIGLRTAAAGFALALLGSPAVQAQTGQRITKGDFNEDGHADFLWWHDSSGEVAVWFLHGTEIVGGAQTDPPGVSDTNWKVVGTHDFNHDGLTDILWRHELSGENVLWYMKGHRLGFGEFTKSLDPRWRVVGTADFNQDGLPDILWHREADDPNGSRPRGQNMVWFMAGSTPLGEGFVSPLALSDPNWLLVGVGDFNGDGRPDILGRNRLTDELMAFFLDGLRYIGKASLAPNTSPGERWELAAIADYNGDGFVDLGWRQNVTGENVVWLMEGVTRVEESVTNPLIDRKWHIVGPR
jgi:hypothetical protein